MAKGYDEIMGTKKGQTRKTARKAYDNTGKEIEIEVGDDQDFRRDKLLSFMDYRPRNDWFPLFHHIL